ncbi:MAG: 6-phosphogluconolactonase [Planctomycetales bacterium]|nr:6-phosphogluconolactonase [Planctomycetales bacterium]
MRYLAIDHGQKRTGLAVCDASQTLITPCAVIETSSQRESLDRICRVLDTEMIDAVVIGLPVNMDGTEGPRAKCVRQFAWHLAQRTSRPILFQDERLSSFEAESLAAGLDLTRKKKKKRLDAIAASAILQAFLDSARRSFAKPHILKAADFDQLAELAFDAFCETARQALLQRGVFRMAICGGRTPERFYEKLADADIAWEHVHLFWVDERCVEPDDPASNFGMAMRTFLQRIAIPAGNIHRIKAESGDAAAAADYEQTLRSAFVLAAGQRPQFDLIVLGMGDDGHIGSIFPDAYALLDTEAFAAAVDRPDYVRITLTAPVIREARSILILAAGDRKADILRNIFTAEPDPLRYPVWALWPALNKIIWIIDAPAALLLEPEILK